MGDFETIQWHLPIVQVELKRQTLFLSLLIMRILVHSKARETDIKLREMVLLRGLELFRDVVFCFET